MVRTVKIDGASGSRLRTLLRDEWLVTNGLGGYASGTICGNVTRRYHGVLIAALSVPLGRVVMLNHLAEFLYVPGDEKWIQIGGCEPDWRSESENLDDLSASLHYLKEFRLENQLPVWRFEYGEVCLEKRVYMIHSQNTTCVSYELKSGQPGVQLRLRPSLHFRQHEHPVDKLQDETFQLSISGNRYEVAQEGWPSKLRMAFSGGQSLVTLDSASRRETFYLRESEQGYESCGQLWTPGSFEFELTRGRMGVLIASSEDWERILALSPEQALDCEQRRRERLISLAAPQVREGVAAELVLAADQFIIAPVGRTREEIRTRAAGDEMRTLIAGYHWFTDWGRDTMISLEGLTLATGRYTEAGWILRTFANYIRDGLIPNLIPEGTEDGLYHTADATFWFFHALNRYVEVTGDRLTLRNLLPKLIEVIHAHRSGTRFGIKMDPEDGLICQGVEGLQLTWMDAKVGNWVVTPRRGKAVEINALWYNALKLTGKWMDEEPGLDGARDLEALASRVQESFNRRFWNNSGGYLFDVVDGERGNDPSFRPNQLLAISLAYPVLDRQHWPEVLDKVTERLLTPMGLRSLSRDELEYKSKYFGDLRARDSAYHQGTVWGWLIGPYIDAFLKIHPEEKEKATNLLLRQAEDLNQGGMGSLSEIFDAEPPFTPRGCIAQAWSVAEALRCWVKVQQS